MKMLAFRAFLMFGTLSILFFSSYAAVGANCTVTDFNDGSCAAGPCEYFETCQKITGGTGPAYVCKPAEICQKDCEPDNGDCSLAVGPPLGYTQNDEFKCANPGEDCYSPINTVGCSPVPDPCTDCTDSICIYMNVSWMCGGDINHICTNTDTCSGAGGNCTNNCDSTEYRSWEYQCGKKGDKCCIPKANAVTCDSLGGECMNLLFRTCPKPGYIHHPDGDRDCGWPRNSGACCENVSGNTSELDYTDLVYNGPVIDNIASILNPIVKILYYGGLALGVFFIILSGYKLMTSQGDPQKTKEGQEQLTAAILGIFFILLSAAIIRIILNQVIGVIGTSI